MTQPERFVWDYWYVKDQYKFLRTPAYLYFPQDLYQNFHSDLVQWGRKFLGCHNISPTWLSYYVEGCKQDLHADVPHGPWAFVYSLSLNKRKFSGGETLILKPEVLNYWQNFAHAADRERASFIDLIAPKFNRLVVFDPRFPHGVSEVKGVEDPLEARLVIHGWFVEPRPYVEGSLTTSQVKNALDEGLELLQLRLQRMGAFGGTLSFRLKVNAAGLPTDLKILTHTLIDLQNMSEAKDLVREIRKIFAQVRFPKSKANSQITVPLLFK